VAIVPSPVDKMWVGPNPPVVMFEIAGPKVPSCWILKVCKIPGSSSFVALHRPNAQLLLMTSTSRKGTHMRNDGSTAYLSIQEVLGPVGFCLTRVKVFASESKRYVAMKLTNPPASMFSATIASLAVNEWAGVRPQIRERY